MVTTALRTIAHRVLGGMKTGRQHARDARLAAFRAHAGNPDWSVMEFPHDLTLDYPVAPLLGALSAQAELAITGPQGRFTAVVASVLVVPPGAGSHHHDQVAQLTTLDANSKAVQFTATWHRSGPEVVLLSRGEFGTAHIEAVLRRAAGRGDLCPGDHVAAEALHLVHVRTLARGESRIDFDGPLRLLCELHAVLV